LKRMAPVLARVVEQHNGAQARVKVV